MTLPTIAACQTGWLTTATADVSAWASTTEVVSPAVPVVTTVVTSSANVWTTTLPGSEVYSTSTYVIAYTTSAAAVTVQCGEASAAARTFTPAAAAGTTPAGSPETSAAATSSSPASSSPGESSPASSTAAVETTPVATSVAVGQQSSYAPLFGAAVTAPISAPASEQTAPPLGARGGQVRPAPRGVLGALGRFRLVLGIGF